MDCDGSEQPPHRIDHESAFPGPDEWGARLLSGAFQDQRLRRGTAASQLHRLMRYRRQMLA